MCVPFVRAVGWAANPQPVQLSCAARTTTLMSKLLSFQEGGGLLGAQASAEAVDLGEGEQRTAAWHAERDRRLTASAFGNALGCAPPHLAYWRDPSGRTLCQLVPKPCLDHLAAVGALAVPSGAWISAAMSI